MDPCCYVADMAANLLKANSYLDKMYRSGSEIGSLTALLSNFLYHPRLIDYPKKQYLVAINVK